MIINIKNRTDSKQQVLFCDGSGEMVLPGQAIDIEEGKVYGHELVRLKKFFKFTPQKVKNSDREVRVLSSETENNDGGNE